MRLGHRWIERGPTRICINCSVMMEEVMNSKTGKMMKVYKKEVWQHERPNCVAQ
jgi:hypothetical protein